MNPSFLFFLTPFKVPLAAAAAADGVVLPNALFFVVKLGETGIEGLLFESGFPVGEVGVPGPDPTPDEDPEAGLNAASPALPERTKREFVVTLLGNATGTGAGDAGKGLVDDGAELT